MGSGGELVARDRVHALVLCSVAERKSCQVDLASYLALVIHP
jgi:hypothetical protein